MEGSSMHMQIRVCRVFRHRKTAKSGFYHTQQQSSHHSRQWLACSYHSSGSKTPGLIQWKTGLSVHLCLFAVEIMRYRDLMYVLNVSCYLWDFDPIHQIILMARAACRQPNYHKVTSYNLLPTKLAMTIKGRQEAPRTSPPRWISTHKHQMV